MKASRLKRVGIMALGVGLCATAAWAAEQAVVKSHEIYVLRGKGSMYLPPLATVKQGATLDVLGHEGRWLKVQYGDVQGYALESAVNGQNAGATGGSTGSASDANAAAAARGFQEQTVVWAKSHSYNREGLNAMFATRQRIADDPEGFEKFKADGHVGGN